MGIRFHCPNGHKLNVKSFLAGKKGVCPDCGTRVRIPDRSEPGLAEPDDDDRPIAATLATPQPSSMVEAVPQSLPTPVAVVPVAVPQPVAVPAPAPPPTPLPIPIPTPIPMPAVVPTVGCVAVPAPVAVPPPSTAVAADPIAENPLATWFVRPPSGGQFGPARGEVMRKWLTEGRVTRDSLVWREGWSDWLPATEVFPSLGKPAVAISTGVATTVLARSPASAYKGRKSGGSFGVAVLVFLAVVCLALVGVLAFVLSGGLAST